jgi:hypothetical protein
MNKTIAASLAVAIALAGCSGKSEYSKLPTATEVFALRTRCVQLGNDLSASKMYADREHGAVSNYNSKTNRCYVTLIYGATKIDEVNLYDGQTGALLASMYDDPKMGTVVGDNDDKCNPLSDCGYNKAKAYIDQRMKREE